MATVDESLLQSIAQGIAREFKANGINLNDAIKEKATELNFNREQTARLIERTNTEAFLAVFPDKKEFEVGDPKVILSMFGGTPAGTKEASHTSVSEGTQGRTKVANFKYRNYKEAMQMSAEEIFGMDPNNHTKVASYDYDGYEEELKGQIYRKKIARAREEEVMRVKEAGVQLQREQAISKFYTMYKEAALRGTSTDTIEEALILKYPTKQAAVASLVDTFNSKLAKECFEARPMLKRASYGDINYRKVVGDTPLTAQFGTVLKALELN